MTDGADDDDEQTSYKSAVINTEKIKLGRLPNLVVITLLENYDYFVHTLDTIGNQWEIFVYRFDLPVTSLYNNDICEKFMISMHFGDWIHLITHCSMI